MAVSLCKLLTRTKGGGADPATLVPGSPSPPAELGHLAVTQPVLQLYQLLVYTLPQQQHSKHTPKPGCNSSSLVMLSIQ